MKFLINLLVILFGTLIKDSLISASFFCKFLYYNFLNSAVMRKLVSNIPDIDIIIPVGKVENLSLESSSKKAMNWNKIIYGKDSYYKPELVLKIFSSAISAYEKKNIRGSLRINRNYPAYVPLNKYKKPAIFMADNFRGFPELSCYFLIKSCFQFHYGDGFRTSKIDLC
jgi:hypothetical protein